MSKASANTGDKASGLWAERMAHANAIEGNPLTAAEQALIDKLIAEGTDAQTTVQMIVDAAKAPKDKGTAETHELPQPATVAE